MTGGETSFYITGGTLQRDAPSYVERKADRDLYQGLQRGEYCYVLTSRQMGKSSLMVRTAARLQADGIAVVVLDLTAIGQNLTVEQWYDGLLGRMGRQIDQEDELEAFWEGHERLGPLRRWMTALQDVVLAKTPTRGHGSRTGHLTPNSWTPGAQRLVIFIDEIDAVRSLPFSTDEFFAAIRECYNRRTQEREFQRLTFCLLGVATPSDLIHDIRTTPFNIGRRIDLTDFSAVEAAPLAQGLGGDESAGVPLLNRVLYWTGGHPYLTQRLCQAVAEGGNPTPSPGVDSLCEKLFLSQRARARDNNLLFVRDRLLRSEADRASLLDLYAQVRSVRKKVPDDETNSLIGLLRLSGIVREQNGHLRVRNRIYSRVFDRNWVEANMPDAELRRLRALAREEARKRRQAEERELTARRYLYAADMKLAQQAWEMGNLEYARELLESHRPRAGEEDLRSFLWCYLWRLCQGDQLCTLAGHQGPTVTVVFSPDGKFLASGSTDGTVKLWDIAKHREVGTLSGHKSEVRAVAFSPDGKILASGSTDQTIKLWEVESERCVVTLEGHTGPIDCVAFSSSGETLASGGADRTVQLWEVATWRSMVILREKMGVGSVAFWPNDATLAVATYYAQVKFWDINTRRVVATLRQVGDTRHAFSPDGRTVATCAWNGVVTLSDALRKRPAASFEPHTGGGVCAVAFSPDGKTLVTGSPDTTVKLWDVATRQELATHRGHIGDVSVVAFSPDGKSVASGSADRTVRRWGLAARPQADILQGHRKPVHSVVFSPDGQTLASGSRDGTVRLWDVATNREMAALRQREGRACRMVFFPNGKILAVSVGTWDSPKGPEEVTLWDMTTRRAVSTLVDEEEGILCLDLSPDGKILATGGTAGAVRLWDVASGRALTLAGHEALVHCLRFSPNGKALATASWDHTLKLWDVASRTELATLEGHTREIDGVAFSPDGKIIASCGFDKTVRLWMVGTNREIATVRGHKASVQDVMFSPDGKTLASGSSDHTVKLWDVATRREIGTLNGHRGWVWSVSFSPDGNILATASADGSVRLWRAISLAEADVTVQ